MKVRLCKSCGYTLQRKSNKCFWCKTPAKKLTLLHYSISGAVVLPILFVFVAPSSKYGVASVLPSANLAHSKAVKTVTAQHPAQLTKTITQRQAFSTFMKYFEQFNAEIKTLKGTTFFSNAEYLNEGVLQVTATDIFLSTPDMDKKKYVEAMAQKWQEVRKSSRSAVVRIVDTEGILRMAIKRG